MDILVALAFFLAMLSVLNFADLSPFVWVAPLVSQTAGALATWMSK